MESHISEKEKNNLVIQNSKNKNKLRRSIGNTVACHGDEKERDGIKETEIAILVQTGRTMSNRVQVVVRITKTGIVSQALPVFVNIEWCCLVLDGAHRLER